MKHIFINIQVQNGEFQHDHKVLISTKCKSTLFAVNWYIAHFWGFSERYDIWWEWDNGLCGKVTNYAIVPEEEYEILFKYL